MIFYALTKFVKLFLVTFIGEKMNKLMFATVVAFSMISGLAIAQEYKYQPSPNKAEYYFAKYKDGKNLNDLIDWVKNVEKNILNKTPEYENFEIVLLSPYFHRDLTSHDVIFVGLWPNSTEQYKGLDYWVKNGNDAMSKIPVVNHQIVDTWQWSVSVPEGEMGVAATRFSACKMKEGVTGRAMFDAYMDFAKAAKLKGDNLGRKMIFPTAGATEGVDYDFVYLLYANTVAELGAGSDNYWQNINGSAEDQKLGELLDGCFDYNTWIANKVR